MSKLLVALLSLLCPCALAHSPDATSLTIAFSSPNLTEAISAPMRAEVSRILKPAGLDVAWMSPEEASKTGHLRLVVIRTTGSCIAEPLLTPRPAHGNRVLASTTTSESEILPFATVDCDALRRLLVKGVTGRALGRLIAHEIYHMLGQTRGHHSAGVSRQCFSASDLTGSTFDLDPAAIAYLKSKHASAPIYISDDEEFDPAPAGR